MYSGAPQQPPSTMEELVEVMELILTQPAWDPQWTPADLPGGLELLLQVVANADNPLVCVCVYVRMSAQSILCISCIIQPTTSGAYFGGSDFAQPDR
jgi:hypothetical protein